MSGSKAIKVKFKIQSRKKQLLVSDEDALLASPSELSSGTFFPCQVTHLPRMLADLKYRSFGII